MDKNLLPYYGERQSAIDLLIIHCNAFPLDKFLYYMHEYKTSAHYYIDLHGNITQLVSDDKSAYHSGIGYWQGSDFSPNSRSLGIELQHPTLGQSPYNETQISALISFAQELSEKYKISKKNIIGHSDISPDRKPDPGPFFPWQTLAKSGLGIWYNLADANNMTEKDPQKLLSLIGYDTRDKQKFLASTYAFCRHFLPQYVKIDNNIQHLVDNTGPDNYDFLQKDNFLPTLQAVAYAYSLKA